MKKLNRIFMVLLLAGSLSASKPLSAGFGIGAVAGDPTGITLKFNNFPVIEAGWSLLTDVTSIHVNVDYWVLNKKFFSTPLNWFVGIGGTGKFSTGNNNSSIGLGARIPVGLQWIFESKLEIYLSIAPVLYLLPSTTFGHAEALGIRFYFS